MKRRLFLTLPPLGLLFAAQEITEDLPPLVCPVCGSEAELIDYKIYCCKTVGCGVLFRNNRKDQ